MSALFTDPGTDPFHRPWPFETRQVKDWNEYPELVTDGLMIDVLGAPGAQGSKRAWVNKSTGRVQMTEQNKAKVEPWRAAVASQAVMVIEIMETTRYPLAGPVAVDITFWLTRPKTARPWRTWVRSAPDVDKLTRSTFDAMTGIVFRDDGQVVELSARKRYAIDSPTGARISITPLEDVEQQELGLLAPLAGHPGQIGPVERTWRPVELMVYR